MLSNSVLSSSLEASLNVNQIYQLGIYYCKNKWVLIFFLITLVSVLSEAVVSISAKVDYTKTFFNVQIVLN